MILAFNTLHSNKSLLSEVRRRGAFSEYHNRMIDDSVIAEKHWRRMRSSSQLTKVARGVQFVRWRIEKKAAEEKWESGQALKT